MDVSRCVHVYIIHVYTVQINAQTLCRDAVNEMALHFLAKMKILVVRDIEREDIEFVCKVHVHVCTIIISTHYCWNRWWGSYTQPST